jgi:NADH dehydrogenase FAD-containing subunit
VNLIEPSRKRNYFVFTPLLAGTSVGTLEFRWYSFFSPLYIHNLRVSSNLTSVTEPVRYHAKDLRYYQAACEQINFDRKEIVCKGMLDADGNPYTLGYDKLVIACGGISNTFKIPGVEQHAFFLKDISDAKKIRGRVLEC